jgi:hypothetical protein
MTYTQKRPQIVNGKFNGFSIHRCIQDADQETGHCQHPKDPPVFSSMDPQLQVHK